MTTVATLPWERLARAAIHPVRLELLTLIAAADERSPVDLAKELAEPLSNVGYHVRKLLEAGWIEETRTVQVRGAIQHFYRFCEVV